MEKIYVFEVEKIFGFDGKLIGRVVNIISAENKKEALKRIKKPPPKEESK